MGTFHFIIRAVVYLLSFIVVFDSMKCINYEKLLKKGHVTQAQILYYLIVMCMAYLVGSFVMIFIQV